LTPAFQKDGLGGGIGLHFGPLVEGLLGSAGVKFYDVIGDTVNTAKRIESAAESGEVLISEDMRAMIGNTFRIGAGREISAKGKENLVMVYTVEG
jgi:class 3 adenylate cyclase